ncbi:UNVERIFIED_ORG: 16S rRNA (guanine1207-N2)-methyltransferase [Nocardia globerula]|uniref:16S rRNA (Guanine1207-N2)-methyltransferase n=1 Tax=Nocardia globerula TaxID=1818 RepID=A0A652YS93_NOCGL|nr:methyltransferase [Rhodococcus globerulus]NMD61459.1 methyltransferase [Nocardia globerula]PVX66990.1 16S rRNA m(2)G 1207 methyltransferase /23S rRNA m(2)G-1835 methyltransferase [Rhodococcus globerulus]
MSDTPEMFDRLRRFPDIEAPNLFAVDAADRLILDEAADALAAAPSGSVVVVGDHYGALTAGAVLEHGRSEVRVYQDPLTGELALANNARELGFTERYTSHGLGEALLRGARVILMQLPRSLAELGEISQLIALHADPEVRVFAGGRDKHITPAMNKVLAESFSAVSASRGRQKSRVLRAAEPKADVAVTFPMTEWLDEFGLDVVAHGAVFAGASLDIGTRLLLENLGKIDIAPRDVVDLGCGSGILATAIALKFADAQVVATDQSSAAVASAIATASANGVGDRVRGLRDDAMSTLPDASVDLVLLNPPFHVGAAVHTGGALKLFEAAGRVLRPGGQLWTVHNAHLGYREPLKAAVGESQAMAKNAKFIVMRSIKAS